MLRAYCASWEPTDKKAPQLGKEERHHLEKVRRARVDETVEVLNGRGAKAFCRHDGHGGLILEQVEEFAAPSRTRLCVALPKGKVFPAILQKAVELGATEIVPLVSAHASVPAGRIGTKSERWGHILVEALKQSGNPWLPRLLKPSAPAQALACSGPEMLRICAALTRERRPYWETLMAVPPAAAVSFFVGPEGDFSEDEYRLLYEAGCRFVDLGPLVLRVETAASLLLGALNLRRFAG